MHNTIEWVLADVAVVELKGKLDTRSAERMEQILMERAAGARQLVLDLSAVSYINAAGLRVLLAAAHRLRGRLILCEVPPYLKEVLDISAFSLVFPVCATRAEALARVEAAR
jgi:anti-anti-sigma factor